MESLRRDASRAFCFFVVERNRKKKRQPGLPHSKTLLRRRRKMAT